MPLLPIFPLKKQSDKVPFVTRSGMYHGSQPIPAVRIQFEGGLLQEEGDTT